MIDNFDHYIKFYIINFKILQSLTYDRLKQFEHDIFIKLFQFGSACLHWLAAVRNNCLRTNKKTMRQILKIDL
jgi:hypothetical protein